MSLRPHLATRLLVPALLMGAASLFSPAAQAASVLIDDFSAPSPAGSATATGNDSVLLRDFTTTVPGGVREVTYNLYRNPANSHVDVSVGGGSVQVAAGAGALGELLFAYGAFTRPTGDVNVGGPLLAWDLSGYDAIELDFSSVDQALNIAYTLYSRNNGSGLFYNSTGINVAPAVPGGPVTAIIPFASTAFNFHEVDGVFFEIDRSGSATGNRYTLDSARFVTMPVPEPQSAVLMGVGMLVTVGWCRRRLGHNRA